MTDLLTYLLTYRQTWVGARNKCVSKKKNHSGKNSQKWLKMVKIAKSGQNCEKWSKWSRMVQNGPTWSNIVQNGEIWSKWSKMVTKNGQNGLKW